LADLHGVNVSSDYSSFFKYLVWALPADIVLINSGIWRGISAALKVVSVGYLNFVCFLSWYLLVSRFSLAYFRTICFFALVETRVVNVYS